MPENQDMFEFLKDLYSEDAKFLEDLKEKRILDNQLPQTSKPGFCARSISEGKSRPRSFLSVYQKLHQKEPLIQPPTVAIEMDREKARPKTKYAYRVPEYDPFVSWNPPSWTPSPWNPYDYMSEFPDLCSPEFGTPWCCAIPWKVFHQVTAEPKSIRETLKRRLEDYIDIDKLSLSDLLSLHVCGADLSVVQSKHLFTVDKDAYHFHEPPLSQRVILEELNGKPFGRGSTKPIGWVIRGRAEE